MTSDGFFNGSMTIDELVREAHGTAIDKGWHIYPRTALEIHALIHSEIAEATEAARVGKPTLQLEELADAIIRIADYCGSRNWDLGQALAVKMAYNRTRPFRHGGKLA
jgi:NTP pyrophosphatase (non-canonical NTP hydrolase)